MARRGWEFTQNAKKRWYLQVPEGLAIEEYPSIADIRARAQAQGIDPSTLLSDETMEKSLRKALAVPGEEFSFPSRSTPPSTRGSSSRPTRRPPPLHTQIDEKPRPHRPSTHIEPTEQQPRRGLDPVKIKSSIDAFRASPAMELEDLVIAEGTPPPGEEPRARAASRVA
jgi:hypothetical protein